MNLVMTLLAALGVALLLQLVMVGAMLWRHFGTKLVLVNYTVSGGEEKTAWAQHCSSFGRVRGPVTDAKLDFLLDQFVGGIRRDRPDLHGWSLNGVTILGGAAALPKGGVTGSQGPGERERAGI